MIIQTFKQHQFIFCTFFVLLGLIMVYSPSYGGNYNGGPAGGHCRSGDEVDTIDIGSPFHMNSQFRIGDEDEIETDGEYYEIITFQDSIYIYVNFRSNVGYYDINGELHRLSEVDVMEHEEIEEQEYFISGLQPDTEYTIWISGALCGTVLVKTEPLPQLDGDLSDSKPISIISR